MTNLATSKVSNAVPLLGISARLVALSDALSVPDGGFSIDPTSGEDVTGGYAVSAFPECERIIPGAVTATDIFSYMFDMRETLSQGGVVLGGWRDPESGKAYLDVSLVIPDLETALSVGREHNQISVFDFSTHSSIPVATATAL